MEKEYIFRKIVEESIVLLKNEEHILPLEKNKKIAFFGRAQSETFFSGNGSGASKALEEKNLISECVRAGLVPVPELKDFYNSHPKTEPEKFVIDGVDITGKDTLTCGFMYEIFGKYQAQSKEYQVPDKLLKQARTYTDTAIFVLGRNCGGEECDRHLKDDYYLTESETDLVKTVCGSFENVILILNVNGMIDLGWIKEYPMIKGILFMGIPGEAGCGAMADILTGKINPSGKLAFTIAECYEDYPSSNHFTWNKELPDQILTYENYDLNSADNGSCGYVKSPVTVYYEDIYNGYRYFDSFGKEVLFPFGFGLSYTNFKIDACQIEEDKEEIRVTAEVINTGNFSGKETVQIYLVCKNTKSERPAQELKGFEKTRQLQPGEKEKICIRIPKKELSCYVEETASYMTEKGIYQFWAGNSSRQRILAGEIEITEEVCTEQCENRLQIKDCNREKIKFLSKNKSKNKKKEHVPKEPFSEIQEMKIDERVKELSVKELAALCVGYGPGTPFSAFGDGTDPETIYDESGNPLTTNSHPIGANGYVSPAIEEKEIYSIFYKDGPAGIGTGAWPTEMLIACAFNKDLWYAFGEAVGEACMKSQIDVWLAPAVNIQRHPLCGRNFEYFSEDPYLTGVCAVQITKGVQKNPGVYVCPKHFAMNEQESYRRGSSKKNYDAVDSIITERAAREIYLKPFEKLVKEAEISFIMTSFNKINGVFAGGNKDLCTHILKEEWGFQGVVVTDWGDMDIVVDGGDAVAAGNDIIMPGGPPVIAQILKAYEQGRIGRTELEQSVSRLLNILDSRS